MKILVTSGTDRDQCDWDELRIDGRDVHSSRSLCECPEDAMLGRSLTGAHEIAAWLKAAYESGKRGDEFVIERVSE